MQYYGVLASATVAIGWFGFLLWTRTRDWAFVLGIALLYYWSLLGAWFFIYDLRGGHSGLPYQYLEYRLFPVHLNAAYMETIILYALFILTIQGILLYRIKPANSPRRWAGAGPVTLNPVRLLILCYTTLLTSAAIAFPLLRQAISLNASIYDFTRERLPSSTQFYSVHQLCNGVASISISIAVAVAASGPEAKRLRTKVSRKTMGAFLFTLAVVTIYLGLLGDRHELVTGAIGAFLIYLVNHPRPRTGRLMLIGVTALLLLQAMSLTRAAGADSMQRAVTKLDPVATIQFVATSTEVFAAHMSLYGVLQGRAPVRFGYSIYSLFASIIPRIVWPSRPHTIYQYYVQQLHLDQSVGQGYTIHQAAAWYLNFGIAGIFIGATLIGLVWSTCYNRSFNLQVTSRFSIVWRSTAAWLFVADLPTLLRGGPEAYKSLFLSSLFLTPWLLTTCLDRPPKASALNRSSDMQSWPAQR